MKKWIILSLLLSTLPLAAQSTVATGTVSDSTGATYPSAVVSCSIQSSTGETPTINGSPVPSPVTATSDGSGVVSMTLTDNQQIKPTNTKWRCNVIAAAGAPQFTTTSTVSGGSATLPFAGAMPPLSSLASVPFTGAPTGSCYFLQNATDTSNGALYGCTSTFPGTTGSWVQAGGGGASISGTLTPGDVPVATGAHTLGDSHIQDNGSVVYFSEPASYELGTAGTGGVTQNLLAAADTSNPARYVLPVSGNCGVGFALSTAAIGNTFFLGNVVQDVYTGIAEGSITSGHILIGGTSTPGRVKDSGGTQITGVAVGTCVVGKALASATNGNTVPVMYMGLGTFGTSGTATYTGTPTANVVPTFTGSAGQIQNGSITDTGSAPAVTNQGFSSGTNGFWETITNANPGTVATETVCIDSAFHAITCPITTTTGVQGIAGSGAGNAGAVQVCLTQCTAKFDNQTHVGNWAVPSASTAGNLTDSGSTAWTPGVQNFFIDSANSGAGTTALVDILTPNSISGGSGGGGGGGGGGSNRPYVMAVFYEPIPSSSQILLRHRPPGAVTVPTNCAFPGNSKWVSNLAVDVAVTASTTYSLQKNGSQFGTAVVASGNTATFTCTKTSFNGTTDEFTLVAPATPDATAASLTFSLVAQ